MVAVGAIALLFADKVILTPLSHIWSERSDEIAALRKKVSEGRALINLENSFHSRWNDMRTNTLPNDTSLAEQQVLKAFDRWAQSSRIVINSISPEMKKETDDYMTLQCHVDASGRIETITSFLYDVERDPMALKLDNVELTARDSDGQQFTLGLNVSGLVLTPQQKTP